MSIYPRISKAGKSYTLRRYVNGKRLQFYSRDLNELVEYDKLLEKGIIPVKSIGLDIKESELTNFINDGSVWKWIKGYEGLYAISDSGLIKSFWKDSRGQFVKTNNKNGWYLSFRATDRNRKVKTIRVHVAVANAFIGNVPKGSHVHHINENKQDNRVENLQILNSSEHMKLTMRKHPECYKAMNERNKYKQRHIRQYTLDGFFIAEFANSAIAEEMTGVCQRNILQVANKDPYNNKGSIRKQAGGYAWKFADESEVM